MYPKNDHIHFLLITVIRDKKSMNNCMPCSDNKKTNWLECLRGEDLKGHKKSLTVFTIRLL
jgi:hypothetical protein